MSVTEDDVRRASEEFDAVFSSTGGPMFTAEQIKEFQALAEERDVLERARMCQKIGARLLADADESMRRYEEVCKQAEALGIDLNAEMDPDVIRARQRAAADYSDRVQREAAAEARRLFGGKESSVEESAASVLSRGVGRMRV